ncbi:MAG TPA: response regulator transcription factor [Solirubrobacteraceae bacterium]|jgi:DNA-binding NarL/FixJ family response regulator|nr:response regulator transcription factor [Solirubrobacteraceae bacterium]
MTRGPEGQELAPIRALIVDDHDLFRTGLSSLLAATEGIDVVAQAPGGKMGVRLARELKPDVILMDLRMPDLDGLDAIQEIVEHEPAARIIALTVGSDEGDVAAAVVAGACGYLVKDAPLDDVVIAVRAAARGEAWLSPRAAAALLDRVRRDNVESEPEPEVISRLSPREVEVLRLVARGLENSEIAEELGISPRTAKNHLSSILGKLGMTNRIQAAIYAVRSGLA